MSAAEVYERYVKPLPPAERLRLIALTAGELSPPESQGPPKERSLLELEGLGEEIWEGIDAQEYVNRMRDEWDRQP